MPVRISKRFGQTHQQVTERDDFFNKYSQRKALFLDWPIFSNAALISFQSRFDPIRGHFTSGCLYKSCLYLIAAKPSNSVTVPSSFGRLIPSNEIGRCAMATESKSAIASKIRVRRDFKIRFSSSLKSRILSVLLFQVCLREQPQIQIFQSWLRCNSPINFRMFGQITNRNLIVIFASLIDNAQPHFTFRQL